MLSLPTFVASGCVWPVNQMPKALELFIRLTWPLINYAKPLQEVLIKDRSILSLMPEFGQMFLYGLVYIGIGLYMYRRAFGHETRLEPFQA